MIGDPKLWAADMASDVSWSELGYSLTLSYGSPTTDLGEL
jgi:hypothetical protein